MEHGLRRRLYGGRVHNSVLATVHLPGGPVSGDIARVSRDSGPVEEQLPGGGNDPASTWAVLLAVDGWQLSPQLLFPALRRDRAS